MEFLRPPSGVPEFLDWWRPLLAFARRARDEEVQWLVHIDEFEFVGQCRSGRQPLLSVYCHSATNGLVIADHDGQPYRFIAYQSGRTPGRFAPIGVRAAVWRAGLTTALDPMVAAPPSAFAPEAPATPVRRRRGPRRGGPVLRVVR
jgi:hypothetical protein